MKKVILILTLFAAAIFEGKSQNIDTVLVRNLTMQAQDWAWLTGKIGVNNGDSLVITTLRKMRAKVQSAPPANWTTSVTIDSLPGRIVVGMYSLLRANAGENVARYSAIVSAITGKANLAYWLGRVDEAYDNSRQTSLTAGKNILLDQ